MVGEEIVMYFINNKDLEMSTGKIAGQEAHALTKYYDYLWGSRSIRELEKTKERDKYYEWINQYGQKKIILKGKQSILENLEGEYWGVRDLGLTEIEENSLTCICLGIGTRDEFKTITKRLQLL